MGKLVKKRAFRGAGDCIHLGNDGAADAPGNVMGTVLGGPQQFQDILCLLEIGQVNNLLEFVKEQEQAKLERQIGRLQSELEAKHQELKELMERPIPQ